MKHYLFRLRLERRRKRRPAEPSGGKCLYQRINVTLIILFLRIQYNRRFVNVVETFGRKKGPNSNS